MAHFAAVRGRATLLLNYALLTVDSIAVTLSVYLSGGLQSPLYILYLVLFAFSLYHESLPQFTFSVILSFLLYIGMNLWEGSVAPEYLFQLGGRLVLMGVLTIALQIVLLRHVRSRKFNEKMVSRAHTVAKIADLLGGSLTQSKDWIKRLTHLIDEEIGRDGLHCRIVIHRAGQPFLPPSGRTMGTQFPVLVGDNLFGTLMVTRTSPRALSADEQDFFSFIARSLGLALHRSKLWDEFHSQIKKVEAQVLLAKDVREPSFQTWVESGRDYHTLDDMHDLVLIEKGKWVIEKSPCVFHEILEDVLNNINHSSWGGDIDFQVAGPIRSIPPFLGDPEKLRKLLVNMIEFVLIPESSSNRVMINLNVVGQELTVTFGNRTQPVRIENGEDNVRLLVCRKIVEAQGGRFWAHPRDRVSAGLISFTLTLDVGLRQPA